MKLQGIFTPIATPFDSEGNLYKSKVKHNVEKWNHVALSGYLVCGSTGESVYLTTEEKVQLWEWVAEYAAPEKLLLAGAAVESVRETVALTHRAADIGYKAAVVSTPRYYVNLIDRSETQTLYFHAVADQSPVPLVICNEPQETGIDLPAETVAALAEHPNIAAIVEGSSNVEKIAQMLRMGKPGFQVLAGSSTAFAASLAAGAVGAMPAIANAAPYAAVAVWEAHRAREFDAAMDWQHRMERAAMLVTATYGVPGLKHAMDLQGFYGGPPRLPLVPPPPAARHEIEEAFKLLTGA
ncbi:MAG: dihydrodipicolinate synthase family protein [Acidobacteriales bacterium]|nr:dihydrodipicolinate synthase family protein [Terriglobales bacterium]